MTVTLRKIALSLFFTVLLVPAPTAADPQQRTLESANCAGAACQETSDIGAFVEALQEIRSKYVQEIGEEKLIEAAIEGMIQSLDQHSRYFEPERLDNVRARLRGEYGGLGIRVTEENGLIKVVEPWAGMPAFRAGIRTGDIITHLDGAPLQDIGLAEAIERMRGPSGTQIAMKIRRDGVEEPLEITLTREVVKVRPVRYRAEGSIGYVQINHFDRQTQRGLEEAIAAIKKELGPRLLGYVIDLRGNPGGLVSQAISVSDSFLDSGRIVTTRGRHPSKNRQYEATPGDLAEGLPIVVLINGRSASASEIVAAALQDHGRAVLLGSRSYGKGTVQSTISLENGGAIRITTARYYTPSNRSIHKQGIVPDVVVAESAGGPADGTDQGTDAQLARAIELLCGDAPVQAAAGRQAPQEAPAAAMVETSAETAAAGHAPRPVAAEAPGGACTTDRPFIAATLPSDV